MDTYVGHVRTPADAIKLFEACRLGLLPRVQRRLSEKERQSIKSGSVFVWDEREAGMRRWTDGKSWSASRVSGSFLTYREMEGKRGGGNFMPAPRRMNGKTPDSGRGSDEDADMDGEGPDGYRYKPDGLMKQSFSITTSTGQHLHLISYYSRPQANSQELMQPTQDPALKHIIPVKGMYPESTVHEQSQGPVTTRTPMQSNPYVQQPGIGHRPQPPPPQAYPYHQVQQQTYANWPPSPVATPPHNYHVAMHYQPQHALPPPGSSHNSPQYMQHGIPQGPPQQAMYDRPPQSIQEQQSHQRSLSQSQMMVHAYAPNPSHRVTQAKLIAEQQAQQAQRLTQQLPIDPRITGPHQSHYAQSLPNGQPGQHQASAQIYGYAPSPPQSNGNAQPSPPSTGNGVGSPRTHGSVRSSPQLNPQGRPSPPLRGGSAPSPRNSHTPPQTHSRPQSQPPTPLQSAASVAPPSITNEHSSMVKSIPSISNLVNRPSDEASTSATTVVIAKDARSIDGSSTRSGSRSPKDSAGSRDVPSNNSDKFSGFGEDARALGVLNRQLWI